MSDNDAIKRAAKKRAASNRAKYQNKGKTGDKDLLDYIFDDAKKQIVADKKKEAALNSVNKNN